MAGRCCTTMQQVGKSDGNSASSSPSAPGPPVDEPITITPPAAAGRITGRTGRATAEASRAGNTPDLAFAPTTTCAPAAAFTFVTISRLSDAALTGAPAVYFSTKSTAP